MAQEKGKGDIFWPKMVLFGVNNLYLLPEKETFKNSFSLLIAILWSFVIFMLISQFEKLFELCSYFLIQNLLWLYQVYTKHTEEQFWIIESSLNQLLKIIILDSNKLEILISFLLGFVILKLLQKWIFGFFSNANCTYCLFNLPLKK